MTIGQRGVEPAPAKPKSTAIESLVEDWVEHRRKFDVRTAGEDVSRWELHLAAPLSTIKLEALSARWVRDLAGELVKPTPGSRAPDGTAKRPVSGPTAHRIITLLSSFLTWCRREGHVEVNVAAEALTDKDVKRLLAPKSDETEDGGEPLASWKEVDQLAAALKGSISIWYLLQARCGLRPGEARALRWTDVDLVGRKLTVRTQVRHGKEGPTKGNRSREVPMVPSVVEVLKAWRKTSKGELVCPPGHRLDKNGKPSTAYKGHLGTKATDKAMAAAFEATEIAPRTAYDAGRVTYATLVGRSGGVSAFQLQKWMGHRDIKTTLRYVRQQSGQLDAAELRALGG
jgi:integrase